jgi:excisionase family DNA binding protein
MIITDYLCILVIKGTHTVDLLTVKETAEMLRVSTITVRRYIASGKLAAVRVGRNIRIRRNDAERVIEADARTDFHQHSEGSPVRHVAEARAAYSLSDKSTSIQNGAGLEESKEDPARFLMEHYSEERQGKVPAQSKFADKSDEWIRENHPLLKMIGIIEGDDGPTDMAKNHDKYLADTHEDDDTPIRNPDGDTTMKPLEWLAKNDPTFWTRSGGAREGEPEIEKDDPVLTGIDPRFADKSDEWILENHPLLKFAGLFEDREGKIDISENHDKYLADAYADLHEE